VFQAGIDHDIYGQGAVALRLLSFFPVPEVISTFQQVVYPMGGNHLSSKPPTGPVITELDPNNLPEDFPFSLEELGMAEAGPQERELNRTEQLIGMTEPGKPPENVQVRVSEPGTGRWLVGPAGGELRYEDEIESESEGSGTEGV